MPFQPGNKEAKKGKRAKLYQDALRMELAAAGDDFKELREIARAHINAAKAGDMGAITSLADRLDGKPAQEQTLTVRSELDQMNDAELREFIRAELAAGGGSGDQAAQFPHSSVTH